MRRSIVIVVVLLGLLVVGVMPVAAITNGTPDGTAHPYVGLVVLIDKDDNPLWRCSGALISDKLFLTAGHCTAPDGGDVPTRAAIWFSPGPVALDPKFLEVGKCTGQVKGYPCAGDASGQPYANPDFCIGCSGGLPGFATRDVGVVVLSKRVSTRVVPRYAQLPSAGLIGTLPNKTGVDFVGYGVSVQESTYPGENPYDRWGGPRTRMYAPSELVSGQFTHSDEFMKLALNASNGSGGTCFGDSGGPDLLGGTDTVLSVNSYVSNVNCSGVGYAQRVDVPEVLAWINSFR